jgi:hypothetical protein
VFPAALLSLAPALLGLIALQPGTVEQTVTRIVIQNEVILRVPVQPRPLQTPIVWQVAQKGPKCIPVAGIQRAMLSGPEQVDFVLTNRGRVRAQLDEDCPALDFYGGFYLQPADNRICANRDEIHSRMGGSCTIERFRQLIPRLREAAER